MGAERWAKSFEFAPPAVVDASAGGVGAAAVDHRHGAPPHASPGSPSRIVQHHNHNPIDDGFLPAFLSLYDFGLSVSQVACVFGVSLERTKWLFKRNGIALRTYDARNRYTTWRTPKEPSERTCAQKRVKDAVPFDRRRVLMPAHVVLIRLLAADGIKQRALAAWFGVTPAAIHHAICGRNHGRIKRALP